MRVNRVNLDVLKMMKDAGCTTVFFEWRQVAIRCFKLWRKKLGLEDNYNAMKWIVEAGLHTTIQLIVGMPGEDKSTIRETSKFVEYSSQLSKDRNPLDLSINYAQALPGTDLYEYARRNGIIGSDIFSEEEYLLNISDKDASDALVP